MDRISDSGSEDLGSNPDGVTKAQLTAVLFYLYCIMYFIYILRVKTLSDFMSVCLKTSLSALLSIIQAKQPLQKLTYRG